MLNDNLSLFDLFQLAMLRTGYTDAEHIKEQLNWWFRLNILMISINAKPILIKQNRKDPKPKRQ